MAKKSELLEQAKALNLKVTEKNTIAEIETALKSVEQTDPEKVTKAGKHSAKGIKEIEDKQSKIEKQHNRDETDNLEAKEVIKKPVTPTRTRLERRGKKFKEAAKNIENGKDYSLKEAIELAKKTTTTKFDASVELHINLNVDPRQADQNIRGTLSLPAGTGKTVRVAVFADVDDAKKAKTAGADIAQSDEFLQTLDKGQFDFDVLISTPQMMAKLGKYARVLGPKGLMPNPKSGTVTKDVETAVKEAKAGKVEYRVDGTGIVHLAVGKASFKAEDLNSNITTVFSAVKSAKPTGLKGGYVQSIYLTTSMGPSIRVSSTEL